MKTLRIVGFSLLLLSALLVSLPASWADWGLRRISHERLRLADCSGTLWRGSGILTRLESGAIAPLVLVTWRFQPMALTAGEARWRLTLDSDQGEGAVTLDWSGWRHSDLEALQQDDDLPDPLLDGVGA